MELPKGYNQFIFFEQDKATKQITDDTRIRAALPTIQYLVSKGAKVVLASHLGRPKGPDSSSSLAPVAERLSELLGQTVGITKDCVGAEAKASIAGLQDGQVLLLENVRWHPEEEKNDAAFAKELAEGCDLYVNDAFGTAHRAHASTAGVAAFLSPKVAGFLMQKELDYLGMIVLFLHSAKLVTIDIWSALSFLNIYVNQIT